MHNFPNANILTFQFRQRVLYKIFVTWQLVSENDTSNNQIM